MTKQGIYKNPTYPLRIKKELQSKVKKLADKNNRKISQQYEMIIEEWINEYEKENGIIEINDTTEGGGTRN